MEAMPAQRSALQGPGGWERPRRHAQRRLAVRPSRSSRLGRREGAAAARNQARGADLPFSSPWSHIFQEACEALPRVPRSDGAPGDPGLLRPRLYGCPGPIGRLSPPPSAFFCARQPADQILPRLGP